MSNEGDRYIIYTDSSLAVMSFIYALEVQGISSCILHWPEVQSKEKEISKILNLKPDERVIMFMSIGYPDPEGKVAFSKKRDVELIRQYN